MPADASPDSSPLSPSLTPDRTITLVGLMGVGKSTVGRRLAQRLGWPFHDGDHEIESAAGMSEADLVLVFKDQRELSAEEVGIFADLLGVPPTQIAHHAGVSTPVPGQDDLPGRLLALERKVAVLEAEIARLKGR